MLRKTIKFIHNLRVFFLAFIFISFLYVIGLNPVDIGKFVGAKIGSAVGMSVSVPENPFNKLALQLKEKEDNLAQKEQELNERELALNNKENNNQDILIIILSSGIVILFILVLLNYYLDYRRKKAAKKE